MCGLLRFIVEPIRGFPESKALKIGRLSKVNVVHRLLDELENRGHIVITDNFFSSVPLFMDLLGKDTYATGTVRANRIGLSTALAKKSLYIKSLNGIWNGECMHLKNLAL